jgi:hypothetical protein
LPVASVDGAAPLQSSTVKLWLRVTEEVRSKIVPALEATAHPILVELLPDGSIRTAEAPEQREVIPPSGVRRWPTADAGLGLFVQRSVGLSLGAPDGPTIGKALPGAYLPIIAYGTRVTEVALPGYKVRSPANWDPVRVFVDSNALGTAVLSPPPAPPTKVDYRDHEVPISVEKGLQPFASTLCGPMRVLIRDGRLSKVIQYSRGIEVEGWLSKEPDGQRGSHVCPPRVVRKDSSSEDPQDGETSRTHVGYVSLGSGASSRDSLKTVINAAGSLFWVVVGEDDELKCIEWQVKRRAGDAQKSELGSLQYKVQLRRTVDKERRLATSFALSYSPGEGVRPSQVSLVGPTSYVGARAEGVALCGEAYMIVESAADHVSLLRGGYPNGIVSYHPDDAETWYLNRQSCEAAAVDPRNRTLVGMSPVHQGC